MIVDEDFAGEHLTEQGRRHMKEQTTLGKYQGSGRSGSDIGAAGTFALTPHAVADTGGAGNGPQRPHAFTLTPAAALQERGASSSDEEYEVSTGS
eukprot:COSAG01_NODE_12004_length_1817_cov_24.665308_2_plen_95_part_00